MRNFSPSIVIGFAAIVLVSCETSAEQATVQAPAAPAVAGSGSPTSIIGKVVETMDAGSYTYVQVDDGSTKTWAAAPKFAVAVGDEVIVPEGTPMRNFESKTLGRTFDVVYFVTAIQVAGGDTDKARVAAAHGAGRPAAPATALDLSNIKKAAGGHTVAELFSNKTSMVGKEVVVRGKVAKFTGSIMGKNWIHVQDGTGSAGTNDMTVTTKTEAAVGDTVLVQGTLAADRDFGFGYRYEVIIEDATVTVE